MVSSPFHERTGIDSFQIREFVSENRKIEKSAHEIILQLFEFPVGIFFFYRHQINGDILVSSLSIYFTLKNFP